MVSVEAAKKLAESYGISYLELSSKSGANVSEAFMSLGKSIKALKEDEELIVSNKLIKSLSAPKD